MDLKDIFGRGVLICQRLLEKCSNSTFAEIDWHNLIIAYPVTSIRVLSLDFLFLRLDGQARDILVNCATRHCNVVPELLGCLERLLGKGCLSDDQQVRFQEQIQKMDIRKLRQSNVTLVTLSDRIIDELKLHDWYGKNPAIDLLQQRWREVYLLSPEEQISLGRNVAQAAEGRSKSAIRLLDQIAENPSRWPLDLIRGIMLETFVNERNEIRIKD